MDLDGFIDFAARIGLDGVELTSYYFPAEPDDALLAELKRRCALRGLEISGGAVGGALAKATPEERAREAESIRRWLPRYERLGAAVVRVFAGEPPKGRTDAEAAAWVREGLEQCIPDAERAGIVLALENHGGVTRDADGVLSVLEPIQSPWVGAMLDTGNFRTADPYVDLARVAPYAVGVHAKLSTSASGKPAEAVDYARVRAILSDAGFRGYLSIEYEGSDPPLEGVEAFAKRLRETFG
jgi:sugar phosphate isomerase/epimerase